jgi:hypothetical protein
MSPDTLARTRGARGRGARSRSESLATVLGVFSIGLGLAELMAPKAICRFLGMEGQEKLVQAHGIRETMAGAAILASHDPTPWIWGRIGGDAIDLVTLAPACGADNPQRGNALLAAALVAGVTALDAACVQGLTEQKSLSKPGDFDYRDRSGFARSPRSMRGAASDFEVPADFRIPDALRPWTDGKPGSSSGRAT